MVADGSGHATLPARNAVRAFEKLTRSLVAVAGGYYEFGHSFMESSAGAAFHSNWTGLAYFVMGHLDPSVGASTVRQFPMQLHMHDIPELSAMAGARPVEPKLLSTRTCQAILASNPDAALNRLGITAIIAVPSYLHPRSLALFFYAAEHIVESIIRLPGGFSDGMLDDVHRLMDEDAERNWFTILAGFHRRLARQDAEVADATFNDAMRDTLRYLADHVACADIQVYLIEHPPYLLPGVGSELPELFGNAGPQYRRQFHEGTYPSSPVSAELSTPLPWVLATGMRLTMHNRDVLPDSWLARQTTYKGLVRADCLAQNGDDPPIAWAAQTDPAICPSVLIEPIRVGGQIIGALVCDGRRGPIHVFRQKDDEGLTLVAEMIGHHWLNRQRLAMARADRETLDRAAKVLAEFSRWVSGELRAGNIPTDRDCLERALTAANQIAGLKENFSSIRVRRRPGEDVLVFRHKSGDLWDENTEVQGIFTNNEYEIVLGTHPTTSAAEYVLNTGTPAVVDKQRKPPPWLQDPILGRYFDRAIFVPIFRGGSQQDWAGVLDIRMRDRTPVPPSLPAILMQLAEQVGTTLASLDGQRELKRLSESQLQAFRDLKHQILTPHLTARRQIRLALGRARSLPVAYRQAIWDPLVIAAGQIRRAQNVGLSAGHYAELHRDGKITTKPIAMRRVTAGTLADAIRRVVDDQRTAADPGRRLSFLFDKGQFTAAAPLDFHIFAETSLFEQLVGALMENAAKYSRIGTEITIRGEAADDCFTISFRNFGYEMKQTDVSRLRKRDERGEESSIRVANGQGIGLWLADAFAAALGGHLNIKAGSLDEPHDFRIVFPFPRTGG